MSARGAPSLIVLGQVTIDDIVPAAPGPWTRQIGGSSLYAVAGARLWIDAADVGIVARLGSDYPFDVEGLLGRAGLGHVSMRRLPERHLVEWLIYEPDGSRRSLPRNPELLEIGAEGTHEWSEYRDKLLRIAPPAGEIPAAWLPARALHLCPQAGRRHPESLAALRGRVDWISVDPSPHTIRGASIAAIAALLRGADAFLPSTNEIQPLLAAEAPESVVLALHRAGFAEVLLKRGAQPTLLASTAASIATSIATSTGSSTGSSAGSSTGTRTGDGIVTSAGGDGDAVRSVPARPAAVVDPTGAGDAFCGAYAACRLRGFEPFEAARRAAATAALVVACSGVEAALALTPPVDF
jgi:ribokinase